MVQRRKEKRTERSKLDATPPWETKRVVEAEVTTGPYDLSDIPDDGLERVDLGALLVPVDPELEVRVEVGDAGEVATINLVNPNGHMQLGVFAAPRREGIWDEVRKEIKASISSQDGTVSEKDGEFGTELIVKLPAPGGFTPVRFIGVDGPRWFVRAMLAGGPAVEESQASVFLAAFRNLVVVRGTDALPARDPIPLRLPRDAAEQFAQSVPEPS
jgi:hypothetical protein